MDGKTPAQAPGASNSHSGHREPHETARKSSDTSNSRTSNSFSSSSSSDDDDFDEEEEERGRPDRLRRANSKRFDLQRHVSPGIGASEAPDLTRIATGRSAATNGTIDPGFEVDFEDDGSDNPREWSLAYKSLVIFVVSFATTVVVLYSTAYASGIPGIMEDFGISSKTTVVLGLTTYLIGLAVGSVILAPLSEMYGRRPIYIASLAFFVVLVIPSGVANTLETILVTRFFGAIAGSAMISNAPGTVSDIVSDEYRALAFSIWSLGPMNGPVIGPLIGGFIFQYLGWRWMNWIVMIAAGVALAAIVTIPETYTPTLLQNKRARLVKETSDTRWWSRYDDRSEFWLLLKVNLSRPFIMTVTEPILIFWDIYIAIVYSILYLCFVAYPIVFSEQRGWAPGVTGLAYCGIGVGGLITISCEPLIRRLINSYRPDRTKPASPTNAAPPEAMVAIICIAAILVPTGELVFAWTSPREIHWAFPILAGIPFGAGNTACFIYTSNYLVHSYGIYAASALAGNAVLRSVAGGCLPLAGPTMYRALGSRYAGTLLGGLEVLCIPIPFVFWRYGAKIRSKSALIRRMREDQERQERKERRKVEGIGRGLEKEEIEGINGVTRGKEKVEVVFGKDMV